jgi:hypothetical protein
MSIVKEVTKGLVQKKKCIVCAKPAEFCMRGVPENTYCRECAKDYFKLLSYLEKM